MGDISVFPHSAYRHTPSLGENENLIPFERFETGEILIYRKKNLLRQVLFLCFPHFSPLDVSTYASRVKKWRSSSRLSGFGNRKNQKHK